ncbi:MAG: type II CAAX endopeptidase family protein [Bryobacteraceae bacterium]
MSPGEAPPVEQHSEDPPAYPFWGYEDVGIFVGMILPAVIVSVLVMLGLGKLWPAVFKLPSIESLGGQLLIYLLLFGGLRQLFVIRYDEPLFASLRWTFPFPGIWAAILGGPLLAISVGTIGMLLNAPVVRNPFDGMMQARWEIALVGVFAVILGPLAEELVFRGFVLPILARSVGPIIGVAVTALAFALLHGPQYSWSWQHILLVGSAGGVFGWIRLRTGSTFAAFLTHATYNMTFFAAFLLQNRNAFPEAI